MKQRRPLMDAGMRYSSNDWLINFLTTPTSFILRRIFFHLSFNVALAAAVAFFHDADSFDLSIPMTGHSLLASSLGLLLSYRTSSAYARFYEGRGHWAQIKATCRNLAILTQVSIKPKAPRSAKHFMDLLQAYPSTLMHCCLGGAAKLSDDAARLLPPQTEPEQYQIDYALPSILMCKALSETLHYACEECPESDTHLMISAYIVEAGRLINSLMDSATSCEKILRTPVPWTYSRHTSRFLTLWMGTLPFALVGHFSKFLTVALVAAAAYCMFGIEEIAHLIEQPFLGDKLEGDNEVWGRIDDDGEVAALIKRGRMTQLYDIGIPVCTLALQIRDYIQFIATAPSVSKPPYLNNPQ